MTTDANAAGGNPGPPSPSALRMPYVVEWYGYSEATTTAFSDARRNQFATIDRALDWVRRMGESGELAHGALGVRDDSAGDGSPSWHMRHRLAFGPGWARADHDWRSAFWIVPGY